MLVRYSTVITCAQYWTLETSTGGWFKQLLKMIRIKSVLCGLISLKCATRMIAVGQLVFGIISLIIHAKEGLNIGAINGSVISIIASISLLTALIKNKPKLMLYWLVLIIIALLIGVISIIVVAGKADYDQDGLTQKVIIDSVIAVVHLIFVIYCWIVVYSYYKENNEAETNYEILS